MELTAINSARNGESFQMTSGNSGKTPDALVITPKSNPPQQSENKLQQNTNEYQDSQINNYFFKPHQYSAVNPLTNHLSQSCSKPILSSSSQSISSKPSNIDWSVDIHQNDDYKPRNRQDKAQQPLFSSIYLSREPESQKDKQSAMFSSQKQTGNIISQFEGAFQQPYKYTQSSFCYGAILGQQTNYHNEQVIPSSEDTQPSYPSLIKTQQQQQQLPNANFTVSLTDIPQHFSKDAPTHHISTLGIPKESQKIQEITKLYQSSSDTNSPIASIPNSTAALIQKILNEKKERESKQLLQQQQKHIETPNPVNSSLGYISFQQPETVFKYQDYLPIQQPINSSQSNQIYPQQTQSIQHMPPNNYQTIFPQTHDISEFKQQSSGQINQIQEKYGKIPENTTNIPQIITTTADPISQANPLKTYSYQQQPASQFMPYQDKFQLTQTTDQYLPFSSAFPFLSSIKPVSSSYQSNYQPSGITNTNNIPLSPQQNPINTGEHQIIKDMDWGYLKQQLQQIDSNTGKANIQLKESTHSSNHTLKQNPLRQANASSGLHFPAQCPESDSIGSNQSFAEQEKEQMDTKQSTNLQRDENELRQTKLIWEGKSHLEEKIQKIEKDIPNIEYGSNKLAEKDQNLVALKDPNSMITQNIQNDASKQQLQPIHHLASLNEDTLNAVTQPSHTLITEKITNEASSAAYGEKDYYFVKSLGKGKHSEVFLAQDKKTGFLFAVKQVHKGDVITEEMEEQFASEIKIHSCANHVNIIRMFGYYHDESYFYLLMEYAPEGEICNIRQTRQNQCFSEPEAAYYLLQLANSLRYLHARNIIHRDLKPENLLLSNGTLKLTDFGYSRFCALESTRNTFCGTLDYLSPKVVKGLEYNQDVDIWSFGVVAYEFLQGVAPFYESSKDETMEKITKGSFDFITPISEEAQDFVRQLLSQEKAPSIRQVCRNHWLTSNADKFAQENQLQDKSSVESFFV